jgi:hypothetical protein
VSVEWYWDDLAPDPDAVEVWGAMFSTLQLGVRLTEVLAALQQGARPPDGGETLDLRDPPHR